MALRHEPRLYFSLFSWWNLPPDVQCCGALGQLNQEPLRKTFRFSIHSSPFGELYSLPPLCAEWLTPACFSNGLCWHIFLPVARKYGLICCPRREARFLLHLVICIVPLWWPPLSQLRFFFLSPHWCTVVFSASGFFFPAISTGTSIYLIWIFFVSFLGTIAKQEKSNLSSKYEWRHRFSDFSPLG